jgi:hypothetical protein
MLRKSVDITAAGDHVIVTPDSNEIIIPNRALLTFAHSGTQALSVTFLSGANILSGPFYVTDGGEIRYNIADGYPLKLGRGEAFAIRLVAGLSCAGYVEYELAA